MWMGFEGEVGGWKDKKAVSVIPKRVMRCELRQGTISMEMEECSTYS